MPEHRILVPTQPKVIREEGSTGIYEIDGLYPGYGHTLGNSLRRIILSSLPGAAITSVKIEGVQHEFSTIPHVKEDVITIILNLKRLRLIMHSDEPQTLSLKAKGVMEVKAKDIEAPSQVEIVSLNQPIMSLTDRGASISMELRVEKGLGYVPKEVLQKERVDIGMITLDAAFTPIRRVNYEVENMRVGDRTDFNRLKIFVETDGTIKPREALERSISIMIEQLKAIVGFKEEIIESPVLSPVSVGAENEPEEHAKPEAKELDQDFLKTRIESLGLSPRALSALSTANIRTVGGLVRKKEEDLLDIEGLGTKGVQEIKKILGSYGVALK